MLVLKCKQCKIYQLHEKKGLMIKKENCDFIKAILSVYLTDSMFVTKWNKNVA